MIIPGSLNTKSSCVLIGMIFVDKSGNMTSSFFSLVPSGKVFLFMDNTFVIKLDCDNVLSPVNHLCCHLHQIK